MGVHAIVPRRAVALNDAVRGNGWFHLILLQCPRNAEFPASKTEWRR